MAKNTYFQCKQFRIIQEKSAMKVGTDAFLLGTWVAINDAKNILDVGVGTGILSLILAQRSNARITGIEIEKNAAEEAKLNAKNSVWNNRIFIQNISFQKYTSTENFDLIISNPPFFENSLKSQSPEKSLARHTGLFPFSEFIIFSKKHLNNNGRLALILPSSTAEEFIYKTEKSGLHLNRLTKVKHTANTNSNRYLMEFSKLKKQIPEDDLILYETNGKDYSSQFKFLTKDFYL